MKIYCCECKNNIDARLTDGREVYPHRSDLFSLPFWKCDSCKNFVGCHHKSKTRTKPLGCIPNQEIKKYRVLIHSVIDPLWKEGLASRGHVYQKLSQALGRQYHTAELRDMKEVDVIIEAAVQLSTELRRNHEHRTN